MCLRLIAILDTRHYSLRQRQRQRRENHHTDNLVLGSIHSWGLKVCELRRCGACARACQLLCFPGRSLDDHTNRDYSGLNRLQRLNTGAKIVGLWDWKCRSECVKPRWKHTSYVEQWKENLRSKCGTGPWGKYFDVDVAYKNYYDRRSVEVEFCGYLW